MLLAGVAWASAIAWGDEAKPGAGLNKPLSAANEAALAECLKDAFDEGYIVGPRRMQEAQKHLAHARRIAPGDPRIDYAQGLMLLKQSQMKPAVAQFEAAIGREEARYWPAWQASIWGHLVEKHYESGLSKLDEFAETVQKAEKPDEVSEAQRTSARWIGQLIEALSRCADSKKVHDLLAAHEVHLLDTFGDELSEELEAGRESIREREFELEQAAGAARQTADKSNERRRKDKAARLEKDLEGLSNAKKDSAKSAEDWKAWLDDTLAKADKQLGLFERDYKFLDERIQSLTQSITMLGREITALEVGLGNTNPRTANPFGMQNAQWQLLQRQNQMLGYQLDYNATLGRQQQVAQQGSQAAQGRADAVRRYETATGELVKKNAGLDKWTARLNDEKQKLTVQKPAAKAGKRAPLDKKQQFSLKTFLPLDLDIEKHHVLASFEHSGKEVADENPAGGK